MKIGFVGLGKMGFNMVLRLKEMGFEVVAIDTDVAVLKKIQGFDVEVAYSLRKLAQKVPSPRIIWLMVPAGRAVDSVIWKLGPYLEKGDIIIDGGNSFYKDSIRRHGELKAKGIGFADVGTSGGLEGALNGASLTIGCDKEVFIRLEPICKALAANKGYAHVGESGAGHFVKMVHNGMEYAMLQAYGEGFELLFKGPYKNLDLKRIAETWQNGSIIRSYLLALAMQAFEKDPILSGIEGVVGGGKTGTWAVKTAKECEVDLESVKLALKLRARSKKKPGFYGKVIAALRREFGGHEVVKK